VTEPATASAPRHDPAQELQVRQTAQRLLADHLRRPLDLDLSHEFALNLSHEDAQGRKASPKKTFWPRIRLDLSGATLVDFDMSGISVIRANFRKATFSGAAEFRKATFSGVAEFEGATFFTVWFHAATFSGPARFKEATFFGIAGFQGATFSLSGEFEGATFSDAALFDGVRVLYLDDPDLNGGGDNAYRIWPEGWTVRPDADDPSRGTLVPSATGSH
jgi:uncharacterized protein YjbI with pentapeptide repeats